MISPSTVFSGNIPTLDRALMLSFLKYKVVIFYKTRTRKIFIRSKAAFMLSIIRGLFNLKNHKTCIEPIHECILTFS